MYTIATLLLSCWCLILSANGPVAEAYSNKNKNKIVESTDTRKKNHKTQH